MHPFTIALRAGVVGFCLLTTAAFAADLTGTWISSRPGPDNTSRDTYFRFKQEGSKLTGIVSSPNSDRDIEAGKVNGNHFEFTVGLTADQGRRTTHYEGELAGSELHVKVERPAYMKAGAPLEMVAVKTKEGAGIIARVEPPALHDVKYNGLAKTPPMGWNSWNKFAGRVDDAGVRATADAMVSNGMKDAGYLYVNIDDTWQGERDANGNITTNKRFPNMKALADYVHSKGLKIGIYSSPGPKTCAAYEGSYGHEEQDAKQYAAWGFDYLKYDWCSASRVYKDSDMHAIYQKMGDALAATGRSIVYSLCQYGRENVWSWGPTVGGNLWRTTGDIGDNWKSMSTIGFGQNDLAKWAAPGHWNDPDMLEIGNGGMSAIEYRTHMSLWSMLAAPLLAGNDLSSMTDETKSILLNKEVIAVDQDTAGHQGHRAAKTGDTEVWVKELADGAIAVALFNRGEAPAEIKASWPELGVRSARRVRDLWSHGDVKNAAEGYTATVPAHGVAMFRVNK